MTDSADNQGMEEPVPYSERRPVRSYVLRQGRFTAAQKRSLIQYWPRYGLEVENGVIDPAELFGRKAELVMEVGFGMGDSLLSMLRQQPDTDFIGVEVHAPGVGHLLHRVAKLGAGNLRIFKADVIDVLQGCIPPACLDQVQIFFPDPWPKKRHHKRRLINERFVDLVQSKLKPAGLLHLTTDWPEYADSVKSVMGKFEYFQSKSDPVICRPKTKYEQRAEKLGHPIIDLCYEKTAGSDRR